VDLHKVEHFGDIQWTNIGGRTLGLWYFSDLYLWLTPEQVPALIAVLARAQRALTEPAPEATP
jgi:hypothetical protein